ncbi:MAG: hypothetical protein J3R72DRAFT_451271 [Linnemannia gamsii]|nr:MAG: hypothetical protein J3R72DRAFT_451271 [Linnemannia gamsii]
MRTSPILLLVVTGTLLGLTSAEAPINVCCMAYTTVNNTLYVQGGSAQKIYWNSQFFSLDLTLSGWNTSSPPWKALPVGAGVHSAPFENYHSMTATKDKKTLIVMGSRTRISTYDFSTATWTNDSSFTAGTLMGGAKYPMDLDLTTGLIYIPSRANNGTAMMVYNHETRTSSIVPMYPSVVLPFRVNSFTFVWSQLRKSFLFFGGYNSIEGSITFNNYMIEYQPTTYSWTRIPTYGIQGMLASHCMIPAYGGTKMVVFGGWEGLAGVPTQAPGYSSVLYILDVKEMNWTKLSEGQVLGRRDMACAVIGDNFVTWGGMDSERQTAGALIYNLKTNQWTDTYIATVDESLSSSSLRMYIGVGLTAGVVLGGLVAWLVFRCKRSKATTVHNVAYEQVSSRSATPRDLQDGKTAMQWSPYR